MTTRYVTGDDADRGVLLVDEGDRGRDAQVAIVAVGEQRRGGRADGVGVAGDLTLGEHDAAGAARDRPGRLRHRVDGVQQHVALADLGRQGARALPGGRSKSSRMVPFGSLAEAPAHTGPFPRDR